MSTSSKLASAAVKYDDEQLAIIHATEHRIIGNAFAGCGKTTTAVGRTLAHPNRRFLYLVFNAANAVEAKARFPRNVDVMTTHSLAWGSPGMRQHVGNRLDRSWKAMALVEQFNMRSPVDAYFAQRVLRSFFASGDTDIDERHAQELAAERNLSPGTVMNAVAHARLVWRDMLNPAGKCTMPDDAYLKMYALKNPTISHDEIILDEAQDANPVTVQIIAQQMKPRLTCIGDTHQGIYGFRGAVDAMARFSAAAKSYYLTKTYRFGPHIAQVANTILCELKGERHSIVGAGKPSASTDRSFTLLARTNAHLFDVASQNRGAGVHWIGPTGPNGYEVGKDGPDRYRLSMLEDVYNLSIRNKADIRDPIIKRMASFSHYRETGETLRDGEIMMLCKLVDDHGSDVPNLVKDIRRNAARSGEDADIQLATAHKSKGLEWNRVTLADDFNFLMEFEDKRLKDPSTPIPEQEVNLLYVAATRARDQLTLNTDAKEWFDTLEERKRDRQLRDDRQAQRS